MADKTTTLKTKTNDNVYPNVIGDNMDNAIVNSAHIKHTLTAEHKINFRLDDNVSNLIFNSLQKPAGLTKTKLVGVGTNGQENIEIGDNLTLTNGKLSATGGGGGSIPVVEGTLTTTSAEGVYDITIPEAQTTNFILHFNVNGVDMYALINSVMTIGETSIYKSINDIGFNEQTGAIINYATIEGSGTDLSYVSSNVTNPFIPSKTIYLFGKYSILVPEDSTDTYILPLPDDASTSTYVLKAVNGTVQWVKES